MNKELALQIALKLKELMLEKTSWGTSKSLYTGFCHMVLHPEMEEYEIHAERFIKNYILPEATVLDIYPNAYWFNTREERLKALDNIIASLS